MIYTRRRRAMILTFAIFTGALVTSTTVAAPAPSTTAITCQTVRYGSRGPAVTTMQQRLVTLGYHVTIDGWFGNQTRRVVLAFQRSRGLYVDGLVGPRTHAALGDCLPAQTPTIATYHYPDPLVERWHPTALAAGWAESDWPRLACIIEGESSGIPTEKTGSYVGLLQISIWHWEAIQEVGGASAGPDSLLDPLFNLKVGRALYRTTISWGQSGWQSWGGSGRCSSL